MQSQQQMCTSTPPKLNKNIRTMPNWVNEAQDRVGPKPPAPPPSPGNSRIAAKPPALPPKVTNQPEPDYEVIEFSGQQYSNEPMMKNNSGLRPKTPDAKLKCTLCGSNNPWVTCSECAQQIFCASCDDMFHKHPKRKSHVRKAIEQNLPPIPPKVTAGQPGPTPPVAPPRRSKRGFPTPLFQRKNQVINNSAAIPPPSPTPSLKSSTWHDHIGSLNRGMSFSNRPLPDTPKTPTPTDDMSSRSTTPKSVFDTIQRPPSVTLEKIKSKASATLDRMAILQQRYRQQKEEQEHSRSNSVADQNFSFDQWSNISPSPSHFRSGSMSSGLNSSHFDISDDTHFNLLSRQREPQQQQFTASRNGNLGARNMSTSVFNLNQANRKPLENNNSWVNSQMQQAQSMAQLNCANCSHPNRAWPPSPHQHQQEPVRHTANWNSQLCSNPQLNRSNLSLNMPAMYMMPQHHPVGMYPPPVFMNQRGVPQSMYPYPYPGMPVMNAGVIAMPPTARSRAASRANSRLPSPSLSRKSLSLRKKHSSYTETDPTDDEDSDQDDRRSLISNRSGMAGTSRPRQRRLSSVPQGVLDDDSETTNPRNLRSKIRDQRRGSTAKSVQNDWTPGRYNTSSSHVQPNESIFDLPCKPSKIYSDLDSESSGTRALVQAKIQQKLEEGPNQNINVRKSIEATPNKNVAEVQVGTVRNKNQEYIAGAPPASGKLIIDKEQVNLGDGGNQYESEEEEGEVDEAQNENGNKAEKEVIQNAIKSDEEDDSPPLGPPPSTPDHEWECEFCTYVNEPQVKICSICCKTPSKPPTAPKKQTPKAQVEPTVTSKSITSTLVGSTSKAKATGMKITETNKITNDVAATSKLSQSEDDSEAATNKMKVQINAKNSVDSVEDIWAALDENIQATAGEVIRNAKSKNSQKVSTGCGPSPPREIKANTSVAKVSKEIGTSPPPQTTSTQTYETLPTPRVDTNRGQIILPVDNKTMIQTGYVDSSNFKSPTIAEINSTETRSPSSPDSNLAFYRDVPNFQNERDRYRSSNDLHQSETSPIDFSPLPHLSGLGRRQSSVAELLGLQRAQSQMHPQYNLQSFPGEQSCFEYKPVRDPETELYLLIKEAELYKFTSEELHVALKHCGSDIHPVQWLRENWAKLIQTVQSLATKYGQERAENTIGTISKGEAREALCIHFGNIWQAVSECIEQRQRKYREISNKGNFSREDIVTALTAHHGNVESALIDLTKTQLKPFLMRIWGSPGGIENESGTSFLQSPVTQSILDVSSSKSDIHEFINANALERAQNPTLTASLLKEYSSQNHSSPNDHHYRLTDNLSNFSHDSKESTVSPFQLEEPPLHNKSMLKDLETLIGNMEQNHAKQNEEVLRNIEGMFSNLMIKKEADPSDFSEERIFMKSPISTPRTNLSGQAEAAGKPPDVKSFVWQHIQEIVPDLVQQVEKELMERDENDQKETNTSSYQLAQEFEPKQDDDMIMESLIKPNIKNSTIREEAPPHFIYAAEIANFRMEFDRALDSEQEANFDMLSLEEAPMKFFKMFLAQKIPLRDTNASEIQLSNASSNDNNRSVSKIVNEAIEVDEIPVNHQIENITTAEVLDTSSNFQDLSNVATDQTTNFSSQPNLQMEEPQSQLGETELLILPFKVDAQTLFFEQKNFEGSTEDYSTFRYSKNAKVFNGSTNEHEAMSSVERPLHSNMMENAESSRMQIEENKTTIAYESTNSSFNKLNSIPPNEIKIQSEIAVEKPSTSKLKVTQKPIDMKSQLPRQRRKITVDRPETTDVNVLRAASIPSESNSTEVSIDFKDSKRSQVQPKIITVDERYMTTDINSSKISSELILNELESDWEETKRSLPVHAEEISANQNGDGSEQIGSFKNEESMSSTIHHVAESTIIEAGNTTNTKVLKSVKSSKIPVRRITSISNTNNQRAKPLEMFSTNLDENQKNSINTNNMYLDVKVPAIIEDQTDASIMSHQTKAFAEEPISVDFNSLIKIKPNPLTAENVKKQNINVEENADNGNNSDYHDVFQDVVEHSSDDEDEDNIMNSIGAKAKAENQNNEYEESSDEELFSLHSNNTAAEEETSAKSDKNVPEHNQQEHNNEYVSSQNKNLVTKQNGNTILKDFVHSSDPSKQNLSELVMDTKRLIKQMKDEINLVELESSEDEAMDDYSDEYEDDSGETEDWNDEEGEEEAESDFNEEEQDGYEEENRDEEDAHADDDYTETRYEFEHGGHAQSTDLKSDLTNDNNQNSNVSKRSTIKSHTDGALSTDSEIEDIEHDDLKEKSNRHQNQHHKDPAILIGTELNSTQSLSFGASSSITNTQSQTTPSNIESFIVDDIPFIAEIPEPINANTAAQQIDSTATLNTQQVESQAHNGYQSASIFEQTPSSTSTYPQDSLNNQTVETIFLPLTEVINETKSPNEQENSSTAQDLINTQETISIESVVSTEVQFQPTIPLNIQIESQASPQESNATQSPNESFVQAVENTEPHAHASLIEGTETAELHEHINTIPETDGAYSDEKSMYSSSPTDVNVLKSQNSTYKTDMNLHMNTVIQYKALKENSSMSKIPKPKESKKTNIKSKVPLRSKSFSGPPTPIGISSVKAIQKEFLNRQTQLTTTPAQLNPPPTVFRKKSITETISKLTKPFNSLDGPSTSVAAASVFRARTQPRLPKKKYHETCFSDEDYQTSSSETEPEPLLVRQRQQSVPVFRTYPSIQEPEVINPEILARNLIEEQLLENFAEAQIAAALINMKFQKDVSIWAAKECSDLDQAIGLLQQECELCMGTFALNQMVSMMKCTHKCCKECAKSYFTVQITDRSINDCNCPFCKMPELHGQTQHEDENLEYFSNLDIFLKSILEAEVHELFQRKLRDRTLLQDPNFKWCVQCSSGFFARPKQKRLICPDCGSVTCSQCRKVWEKQHEGISCEKYWEWKEANDPEIQAQGVQQHLAQHGIDCPKCKFRYSLARGGCMHFTCTQCKFEFCYGCAKPFMMGAKCSVSPYCSKLGLHAHHPRNCLFYLRDKLPLQLQFLLKQNGASFDVDPVISQDEVATQIPERCPVPLQKETPKGLVDAVCNGEVSERHAGLCRTHYVEYLSAKVAKARIDPLPIFDLTDCIQELRRRGIPLPERGPWDTDEIYKGMCSEIIKQKIPLEMD